jgi:tetratricopeptide (TPR) repeat protein
MGEVIRRILDQLGGANLGIALVFLAAGYLCWLWIGTTAADKKKVLRRQISVVLIIAVLAGAAILVNHFVFQRERSFSKNLTGVLVTRIVGDDNGNSLQADLVGKLNAELQKQETAQEIVVHASSKIVNENDGLEVAHEHARAIGQRLNAKIVIWGRKIGENKFYPRITVVAPPKDWSAARERTHDAQSITELHLPEELVDEPFYLIHFAAGYSYFVQGKYEEAFPHFKAALGRQGALPNELADLQFFTAFCLSSLGLDKESEAANSQEVIGLYEKAARVYEKVDQKKWVITQNNLGIAYSILPTGDRAANTQKAVAHYDEAIRVDPKFANPYIGRGNAYQSKNEPDKAIADYDEAIRLDPKRAFPYTARGNAYQFKNEPDKAIADYDEAIRLDPKFALSYTARGNAYQSKNDYDKAIADYDEAIRLDPKDAIAYNSLAWLLATCAQAGFRDGQKAVEYAAKAFELSEWKSPDFVDTLAAAYAEVGDFEQAIKWETNFLGTSNLSGEDTAGGKSRLALYQAHQPYHAEK